MLTMMPKLVAIPGWFGQSVLLPDPDEVRLIRAAVNLYDRARNQGWGDSIRSRLLGRPHRLLRLELIPGSAHYAGLQTVPTRHIRGSVNRCSDFDALFRPMHSRMRDRWVSIAAARLMGATLPPVELIQVGDTYYVRDGHHRISVALAIGEEYIEAHITAWVK